MAFEYACFISYRNGLWENNEPQRDLLNTCAVQLHDALESALRLLVDFADPVFLDQKNLNPGQCTVDTISAALYRSICMVVIYTPNYLSLQKMFCAAELYGMIALQNERNNLLPTKSTAIFAAMLEDGVGNIPTLFHTRIYLDISRFELGQRNLSTNSRYNTKIRKMAREIARLYNNWRSIESQLDNLLTFRIPDISTDEGRNTIESFIREQTPVAPPPYFDRLPTT